MALTNAIDLTASNTEASDGEGDNSPLLRHSGDQLDIETAANGQHSRASDLPSVFVEEPPTPTPRPKQWPHVVKEILSTEQRYQSEMSGLADAFIAQPLGDKFPTEKVLLNLTEVVEASRLLLVDLEAAASVEKGDIGRVFVKHGDSISRAYLPFCRGVKAAIKRAETLQANGSPWAEQITRRMESLAPGSQFRLDSFLIKPLQRITRYPLLLRELLKQGYPYPESVSRASEIITDALRRVNEDVRVHELLSRYLMPEDWLQHQPQRPRWDSLIRTLDKKSGRLGTFLQERLSGQVSATADPELRYLVSKFTDCRQLVEFSLQRCNRLVRKSFRCVQCLAIAHRCLGELAPSSVAAWPEDALLGAAEGGASQARWGRLLTDAELLVFEPLKSLLVCFAGPLRLIDACERKRLDYERVLRRSQPDPMAEDSARQDFVALSGRLKEELPELTSLSMQLLNRSLVCFFRLLQLANSEACQLIEEAYPCDGEAAPIDQELAAWMQRLAAIPALAEACLLQELEEYAIAPVGAGSDEDFADSSAVAQAPPTLGFRPPTAIRQSDDYRSRLVGKYKMSQLRRVVREHQADAAKREVDACQGDLVAVLMSNYPSRPSYSLVDTGTSIGLIPSDLLSTKELSSAMPRPAKQPATVWYLEPERVFPHLLEPPPSYETATARAEACTEHFSDCKKPPTLPPLPPLPTVDLQQPSASTSHSNPVSVEAASTALETELDEYLNVKESGEDIEALLEATIDSVSLDQILDQAFQYNSVVGKQ